MTNLRESIFQSGKNKIKNGCSWAWFVFFSQIPFVFWYAKGGFALHPIVVMLPLVGLLNFNVEKRGFDGVGLRIERLGRSLLLSLIFAGFSFAGRCIALKLEGLSLYPITSSDAIGPALLEAFLVDVFIIALWEEIVNRGYIQTRLQAVWGFWGVVITSLLFATLHIPSMLLDYENDFLRVAVRFFETGLAGFALGYVYWRSKSVLSTIAIHGLNNFVITGVFPLLSGLSAQHLVFNQIHFHILWLVGQVIVTTLVARTFFIKEGI
jgi:membrane protease YdiL (CAAX protease family)